MNNDEPKERVVTTEAKKMDIGYLRNYKLGKVLRDQEKSGGGVRVRQYQSQQRNWSSTVVGVRQREGGFSGVSDGQRSYMQKIEARKVTKITDKKLSKDNDLNYGTPVDQLKRAKLIEDIEKNINTWRLRILKDKDSDEKDIFLNGVADILEKLGQLDDKQLSNLDLILGFMDDDFTDRQSYTLICSSSDLI